MHLGWDDKFFIRSVHLIQSEWIKYYQSHKWWRTKRHSNIFQFACLPINTLRQSERSQLRFTKDRKWISNSIVFIILLKIHIHRMCIFIEFGESFFKENKKSFLKCLYPALQSAPVTTSRQGKRALNWAGRLTCFY